MTIPESFFASEQLHLRDVELSDGSTYQIHFKELTGLDVRRWQDQQNSENDNVRREAIVNLLVLGVANEDGTPAFTLEQARTLKPNPMGALFAALLDVNGATKKAQDKLGND